MKISDIQRLADDMKAQSDAVIERMHFEHVKQLRRMMEQEFRHGIVFGIILGAIGMVVGFVFGWILAMR